MIALSQGLHKQKPLSLLPFPLYDYTTTDTQAFTSLPTHLPVYRPACLLACLPAHGRHTNRSPLVIGKNISSNLEYLLFWVPADSLCRKESSPNCVFHNCCFLTSQQFDSVLNNEYLETCVQVFPNYPKLCF